MTAPLEATDLTDERIPLERRLATQRAAVSALADSEDMAEAVPRLLRAVGEGIGWAYGALWMPEAAANGGHRVLRCIATWSAERRDTSEFATVSREIGLVPPTGLPGRVWDSKAPYWLTDVTHELTMERAEVAQRCGLCAGFAFPVLLDDEVLAVLEFFTHERRLPDDALLEDFGVFGFQMGQFIERDLAQRRLRVSRDQLEAILRSVPAGIMVVDRGGRIVFANDSAARMTGHSTTQELIGIERGEVLERWEAFDSRGQSVPLEEMPVSKALQGKTGPVAQVRIAGGGAGADRWLTVRATPVADGNGGFLAVSVLEEISEMKRTEEALRRSETRHRSISRTLQEGLAPPRAPRVPDMDVAVRFRALGDETRIGGDFYDLFRTGAGRWAVVIGDVSGKGVEAAASAALARQTVRAAAHHDDDPAHVLLMLDQTVLTPSRFLTAAYATIEPSDAGVRLRVASAGHPAPLVLRGDGTTEQVDAGGPLLAGFQHAGYEAETLEIGTGDAFVLYTDGVSEAGQRPSTGATTPLEPARLAGVIAECVGLAADRIAERIESAVIEAEAGRPRDDAAIVVLRSP